MSDIRTPQEPGEELKRLVAEIIDKAYFATGLPTHDGREERFRQIEREAALKIENYIQSRIPEVSEEARGAKLYENFLRLWHFADTCAAEGIDVETSTGNIDSGLLCVTVAGQMAPKHVEWFEQANKFNADFRALLSEKS